MDSDNVFFRDVRSSTFSNTGTLRFGVGAVPGTATFNAFNCGISPGNGLNYTCPYIFMPNGTLVPETGQRVGIGPNGAFIGGNGENFVNGDQLQITPQLNRYNISAVGSLRGHAGVRALLPGHVLAHRQLGHRRKWTRLHSGQCAWATSSSISPGGRNRELIRLDNPYLTPQEISTICGVRTLRGQTCPITTAFAVDESMLGLGNRIENARRDTLSLVGGIKGDLGSSWNYEVSVNYGQLKERTEILNNLDTQRMLLAMDAVRDPATGKIVCRSQIDPSAAFGGTTYFNSYYYGNDGIHGPFDPNFQQRLNNDVAACTPVNVLGGQFTDAQKAYLLRNTVSHGKTQLFDATAFISGDTSKFFNLPGGPIGIVLGGEYRTNNLAYDQDPQVQLGYTFYNAIPTFKAPKQKVKEAFGEIRIPIVKDIPFLRELEVDGAARVSNYNTGSTGTVWAWNANLIYSPLPGLRFRGNIARAVRAPNQSELFTPFGQNFSLLADPCDVDNVGAALQAALRIASHRAFRPDSSIYSAQYTNSLPFLSGGNTALQAEVSNSITLGGVFTPRFIPGFSVSVDYYNIRVSKAIQSLSAQFILNQCVDLATINNPFCGFFTRASGDSARS